MRTIRTPSSTGNAGLAVSPDGTLLAVSNEDFHSVSILRVCDGSMVSSFGSRGSSVGEFDSPTKLCFLPSRLIGASTFTVCSCIVLLLSYHKQRGNRYGCRCDVLHPVLHIVASSPSVIATNRVRPSTIFQVRDQNRTHQQSSHFLSATLVTGAWWRSL